MTRAAKWLALLVGVAALLFFAIPQLLSSDLVKKRIVAQLEGITGLPVQLNGGGSISFDPFPSVSYHNVSFGKSVPLADEPPLLTMERMQAQLGLVSALWGQAELDDATLFRPRLNLRVDEDGRRNWLPGTGSFVRRLQMPSGQQPEPLTLGAVTIVGGIVEYTDARDDLRYEVTGLDGTIDWPTIDAPATAKLEGVWRGEVGSLALTIEAPFDLLRASRSAISVSFDAQPAKATFEGVFNAADDADAAGEFTLETPSPSRLIEWLGRSIPASSVMGATSLSGTLNGSGKELVFPDITVETGEHTGSGRLQVQPSAAGPFISGTLAFDTLALPSPELLAVAAGEEGQSQRVDLSFLDGFGLDLRLSAEAASGAPFELTNIAAAAIIRDGRATFEIGDAVALGGHLAGSIAMQRAQGADEFATDLSFSDVDLARLSGLNGTSKVSVMSKGDAYFRLKSTGTSKAGLMLNLNGDGYVRSKDGLIEGVDLGSVVAASRKGQRPTSNPLSGGTPYAALEVVFSIANGAAFLRGSSLQAPEFSVDLGGQVDLVRRNLALRGEITPTSAAEDAVVRVPFFVGGTTGAPLFISLAPVSDRPREQIEGQ